MTSTPIRSAATLAVLSRVGWLACAALLALGSAGIVAGMQHQPGTSARAELTWAADNLIAPGLAASADDLRALADDVDGLGTTGTRALAAITGGDIPAMRASITDGQTAIATIETKTTALRTRLAALPGVGPGAEGRLGGLSLERYQTLASALDATHGLGDQWATLTAGALAAIQVETALLDHDTSTAAAAAFGKQARYQDAIDQLGISESKLDYARVQRDAMAAGSVDVTVLTTWIDRNAEYDAALGKVYALLVASKGKVTKAVSDAIAVQKAALAALPGDTRGLVLIMAEIARGGLNRAVISIEEAKGRLSDAVDAFTAAAPADGPAASDEPSSAP